MLIYKQNSICVSIAYIKWCLSQLPDLTFLSIKIEQGYIITSSFLWDVITCPYPNFSDGLPKQHMKLSRQCVISSPNFMWLSWWRHQMGTFSALLYLCAGNSPVTGEFPAQRPVTRSFDVFFDLCLNKRLSKQSWSWWFETPSHPLWRHCNELYNRALNAILV